MNEVNPHPSDLRRDEINEADRARNEAAIANKGYRDDGFEAIGGSDRVDQHHDDHMAADNSGQRKSRELMDDASENGQRRYRGERVK